MSAPFTAPSPLRSDSQPSHAPHAPRSVARSAPSTLPSWLTSARQAVMVPTAVSRASVAPDTF